jgi:hypothetical protein
LYGGVDGSGVPPPDCPEFPAPFASRLELHQPGGHAYVHVVFGGGGVAPASSGVSTHVPSVSEQHVSGFGYVVEPASHARNGFSMYAPHDDVSVGPPLQQMFGCA